MNSLTYSIEETPGWFGVQKGGWKIRSAAFCSFNAFSRVDVRVEVKIPGGVEAYVIDLRGERLVLRIEKILEISKSGFFRHEATPAIWQEVYLSALLRAILYADDSNYR